MGFLLGAFALSIIRRDFRARGGSAPLVRFLIGFFLMVGCSVFIGCPIKMALRLSAGDLTALAGAAGLLGGVLAGVYYLRRGFYLGTVSRRTSFGGYIMPAAMLLLVAALLSGPAFIGQSKSGPGSLHPAWYYSLAFGLVIGSLAQYSRFCVTGSIRNVLLTKDYSSGLGLAGLFLSAAFLSMAFGRFHVGINDQPGVHLDHLWNFMGLFLVGIGSVLAGGCPFRQLILSGEGDLDAGLTIMGMLFGGGAVYTWSIRSTVAGPTINGKLAVIAGLIFCLLVANLYRKKD